MANLTETQFLRQVVEMLKEALKKESGNEVRESVSRVITYVLGRMDSLPE